MGGHAKLFIFIIRLAFLNLLPGSSSASISPFTDCLLKLIFDSVLESLPPWFLMVSFFRGKNIIRHGLFVFLILFVTSMVSVQ